MPATFIIKKNDRLPSLEVICKDASGVAVDLTAATSAKFIMKNNTGGAVKVNTTAVISSAGSGLVRYDWLAIDTDTAGTFSGEFEITFPTAKPLTFPNGEYITITIFADVA